MKEHLIPIVETLQRFGLYLVVKLWDESEQREEGLAQTIFPCSHLDLGYGKMFSLFNLSSWHVTEFSATDICGC